MDNRTIVEKLVKIAKEITAGLGWDVKLTGGNVGGTTYFTKDYSFPFHTISRLSMILDGARKEVSEIMSKSRVWKFTIDDPGMGSQGDAKNSVKLLVEVKIKFKSEDELSAFVGYLEKSNKVDKVLDWTS